MQEFSSFLHDGQVSRRIHVEDLIEAQTTKGGYHLAFYVGAHRHTEAFAQLCTNRRCSTYDHMLGWICDGSPYLTGIIPFGQCAGRADCDTLSAVDTGGFCQRHIEGTADVGIKSTVIRSDDAHKLVLSADCDAAAAENTLGIVTDQMNCGCIHIRLQIKFTILIFVHTVFAAEGLQLTVCGTRTGQTVLSVVGEQQLQGGLVGTLHSRGVSENFHSLCYRVNTGGNQRAGSLHFYEAHSACADFIDIF